MFRARSRKLAGNSVGPNPNPKKEAIPMRISYKPSVAGFAAILIALVTLFGVPGATITAPATAEAASLSGFDYSDGGLGLKPSQAKKKVREHLEVDGAFTQLVAADLGIAQDAITDEVAATATPVGSPKRVKLGDKLINTATTAAGKGVSVSGDKRVVFAWSFKIKLEGKWRTFRVKDDCTNPLLRKKHDDRPRAKIGKKRFLLPFSKKFEKQVTHTCPSGQVIQIWVTGTVKGSVKATLWIKAYGEAKAKIKQGIDAEVLLKVSVACEPFAQRPPPEQPPGPGCVIKVDGTNSGAISCNGTAIVCTINGSDITNAVICSNYEVCTAKAGWSWNVEQNVCVGPPPPPNVCPPGTSGVYPHCVPPCPPGTTGVYPDCKSPPVPLMDLEAVSINDVQQGQYLGNEAQGAKPYVVQWEVPAGYTATLKIAPTTGSGAIIHPQAIGGSYTATVSGRGSVAMNYRAPGEIPPGGDAFIEVTLKEQTNTLEAKKVTTKVRIRPKSTTCDREGTCV